ncbi:hypothetical protein GCM10028895_02560 [Pontibacter rugosus]
MISVEEAFAHMQRLRVHYGTEKVNLENAAGRILQENITADRDFPPSTELPKMASP